ncbi:MAG: PDZ domain-containing protein [Gammaproteobacteria bacterium]|nr:PDZ domain-containing protein [Gammaproteobacteria bacterium]
MINFSGEIIGINTAILGRAGNVGIAFAIPSNLVKEIVAELIEFGGITRGFLGVHMANIPPAELERYTRMFELDELEGVYITHVREGTAAFEAGIEQDDIITSFNGKNITASTDLTREINLAEIGETVPIELLRDGILETVYVEIRPRTWSGDLIHRSLEGSTLGNINVEDEYFGELNGKGWVIRDIQPDSPASQLDLVVGDVIIPLAKYRDRRNTEIEIYRDGENLTISTRPSD